MAVVYNPHSKSASTAEKSVLSPLNRYDPSLPKRHLRSYRPPATAAVEQPFGAGAVGQVLGSMLGSVQQLCFI